MSVMAEQRRTVHPGSSLDDLWPHEDRPLTVDDLLRQPHDGNRYELVNGILEVTPAPLNNHQRVVSRLQTLLDVTCPDDFEVLSGAGVNLAPNLHRIPDVIVITADLFEPEFHTRPPVLAIEVASRSTGKRDRTTKKREYAAFGIPSYWIVTPDAEHPSLTAYELRDGKYVQVTLVAGDERFEAAQPFPVTVVPRLLVADGAEWRSLLR